MKIFLGWSGSISHKVANALHSWLPSVIQYARPWISSEDIAKGGRWNADLAKELQVSKFGVICVTRENWSSPWINFEAGALSKEIEQAGVSPLLFDVKPSEIQGPLVQFQYVVAEKDDLSKLLKSINDREDSNQRLSDNVLARSFERWWPDLESEFKAIDREKPKKSAPESKPDATLLLNELLEITRTVQRDSYALQNKERAEREAFFAELKASIDQIYSVVVLPVRPAGAKFYGGGLPNRDPAQLADAISRVKAFKKATELDPDLVVKVANAVKLLDQEKGRGEDLKTSQQCKEETTTRLASEDQPGNGGKRT